MDLLSTIGAMLPLAVGIAISPVPIIAVILLLVSSRAVPSGLAFAAGWMVGVVALSSVAIVLSGVLPERDRGASPWGGLISAVLGLLLVVLGVRQGVAMHRGSGSAELPAWMGRVDSMSVTTAAGLGLALSALNPKNLSLGLAAGVIVGQADESVSKVLLVAVFTLFASCTVAGPVLARVVAGNRLDTTLQSVRDWLTVNNGTIMAVLLTVIGVVLIGRGLGEL